MGSKPKWAFSLWRQVSGEQERIGVKSDTQKTDNLPSVDWRAELTRPRLQRFVLGFNKVRGGDGKGGNQIIDAFWQAVGQGDLSLAYQIHQDIKARRPLGARWPFANFYRRAHKALTYSVAPFSPTLDQRDIGPKTPGNETNSAAPLRIAYVLHNARPFNSGGYASRAEGVARGLAAQGAELHMITRPGFPDDTQKQDRPPAPREVIDGLTYHRMAAPKLWSRPDPVYMMDAVAPVKALLADLKPDVVLAASNFLTARPAQIAAHQLGLPFVYEVRGFWEVTFMSKKAGFRKSRSYWYKRHAEAETARASDLVFTLTNAMKAELVDRGVPSDLIQLAPNSVNPDVFEARARDDDLAVELGIPADVPVIGYIGTFADYEGLELLADACALLADEGVDFRLLMVGSEKTEAAGGLGPITRYIQKQADKSGFADKLIMPGRVAHDMTPSFYSLIDVVTLPRYRKPVTEMVSPIKPFEAMAMSKCLLVSGVAALAEIVEQGHSQDGQTGFVFEPDDKHALKAALLPLLRDPDLRAATGARARDWVTANRSWTQTTTKMLEGIRDVVSAHRKPS